jgi:hypothetical protein
MACKGGIAVPNPVHAAHRLPTTHTSHTSATPQYVGMVLCNHKSLLRSHGTERSYMYMYMYMYIHALMSHGTLLTNINQKTEYWKWPSAVSRLDKCIRLKVGFDEIFSPIPCPFSSSRKPPSESRTGRLAMQLNMII